MSGPFLKICKCKIPFICFLLTTLFYTGTYCQTFTRVTSGEIVTDNIMSWGCACADYNEDGFDDVFVGNSGINALYRNNGNGTFTKIISGPIANDGGSSRGGSWGDYNNDGFRDLFVPNNGTNNSLYLNNGPDSFYTFKKIVEGDIVNDNTDSRGSSWGDYNNDGFIDMFVAKDGKNFLYYNNGNKTFTKIEDGIIVNEESLSIGPSWCDYNNEGNIDLFVANMGSRNFLYKNNGDESFIGVTEHPFGTDVGAGASGIWGDHNNDGYFDLFIANAPGTNFFYINNGAPDYTFTKITSGAIATDGGVSYGSTWADFDNDGDLDLFVANNDGTNFYYRNDGPPAYNFIKVTGINIATDGGSSWGSCVSDFNNDGHLDLFISNTANNFLYFNDGNNNNWIKIKCNGVVSNSASIGTRVHAKATINGLPQWQVRDVVGQTTYYSQSSLNIHFGFGDAAIIDSLIIEWPSGIVNVYSNINTNQFLELTEQIPTGFINANFTANQTFSIHKDSMIVQFSDLSTADSSKPVTSWEWDFNNDGVTDSKLKNPEWTYTVPDTYSVSLTVSNGTSSSSFERSNYIIFAGRVPVLFVNTETVFAGPYSTTLDSIEISFTINNLGSAVDSVSVTINPRNINPSSAINVDPNLILLAAEDSLLVKMVFRPNQLLPPWPAFFRYFPLVTVESFRGYGQRIFEKQFFITVDTTTTSVSVEDLPFSFSLSQNYPNPFNPVTTICYQIPVTSHVTLKIFNLLGQEVTTLVNEELVSGNYEVLFIANGLSSGIYFYKLQTGSFNGVRKFVLMK